MANKNLGLRYILLNAGIDNFSAVDICQKIIFSSLESQLMIYGAAESVVKKSDNGREKNCDSAILYLLYVIPRYLPLSNLTLSLFRTIQNLVIIGDYRSKYSSYRLALGKIFFKDETSAICSNCATHGKVNASWQINNNGYLVCGDCSNIDSLINCKGCGFALFALQAKGHIKCGNCNTDLFAGTEPKRESNDCIKITIQMMSLIFKADGQVTQDEVDHAVTFLKALGINKSERTYYLGLMKKAKTSANFDQLVEQFYQRFGNDLSFLSQAIYALLFAASADKVFHPNEDELILKAVRQFKIDIPVYEQMKREAFEKYHVTDINWCYKILECNHNFKDSEIKKKYRELQQKYHPDKTGRFDLPDHIQEMILARSTEINKAYEGLRMMRKGL